MPRPARSTRRRSSSISTGWTRGSHRWRGSCASEASPCGRTRRRTRASQVARRQIDAGAVGLTVATIGEAEVFADAGFTDLFIAYPVMASGPKAGRLRELASRCTLSVGADSAAGLEALAAAMRGASASLRVLIEVDSGGARTGVRPDEAGSLARRATDLGLEVSGAFTHEGHGYKGTDLRAAAGEDAADGLAVAAASLRAEGIEPTVLSAGSTPTAALSAHGAVTEERPGTYVFGDRLQAALAGEPPEDAALMVATTVVSAGAGGGFVIDAGAKILAQDVAPFIAGHGAVVGLPRCGHPAAQRSPRRRRPAGGRGTTGGRHDRLGRAQSRLSGRSTSWTRSSWHRAGARSTRGPWTRAAGTAEG